MIRWKWDTQGLPHPTPGWMACPVCRSEGWIIRHWHFHHHAKPVSSVPDGRCDVALKCTECACCWSHGLLSEADTIPAHGLIIYRGQVNNAQSA